MHRKQELFCGLQLEELLVNCGNEYDNIGDSQIWIQDATTKVANDNELQASYSVSYTQNCIFVESGILLCKCECMLKGDFIYIP